MAGTITIIFGLLLVSSAAWLAAADAAIALGRGWRPAGAVDWVLVVFGFAGILALGLLLIVAPTRRFLRARSAELILLGVVIAGSLGTVEFVLRSIPPPPPPQFHHAQANLSVTVSRKHERPKKFFTTNSEGVRGPELSTKSDLRILCIGGSTTQCHYMDDAQAWSHLLMVELGKRLPEQSVWVGSTGIPGFATSQHLKYVQTAPGLDRYTHAVFLIGVNDLIHWLSWKVKSDVQKAEPPPPTPCWQKLATYRRVAELVSPAPNSLMNAADAWPLDLARRQRAESILLDTYAPPDPFLDGYRTRIYGMIDRCRELGVEPVFVTQPVLWAKDLPPAVEALLWMGRTRVDNEYMSTAALRELMDTFNATLIEACRERDALVVDLAFMSGSTDYFFDDCHFTEPGAETIARTIADALAQPAELSPTQSPTPTEPGR